MKRLLLLLFLFPAICCGQTFGPKIIKGPFPPFHNHLAWWIMADGAAWDDSGNPVANQDSVWKIQNYSARAAGLGWTNFYYLTCDTPNYSDLHWFSGAGPGGLPAFSQTNENTVGINACGPVLPLAKNPCFMFIVLRLDLRAGAHNILFSTDTPSTQFDFDGTTGNILINWGGINNINAGAIPGDLSAFGIMTVKFNGADSWIRINQVPYSTFTTGTGALTQQIYRILNYYNNGANYMGGYLCEWEFYSDIDFTIQEIVAKENRLIVKWGL